MHERAVRGMKRRLCGVGSGVRHEIYKVWQDRQQVGPEIWAWQGLNKDVLGVRDRLNLGSLVPLARPGVAVMQLSAWGSQSAGRGEQGSAGEQGVEGSLVGGRKRRMGGDTGGWVGSQAGW